MKKNIICGLVIVIASLLIFPSCSPDKPQAATKKSTLRGKGTLAVDGVIVKSSLLVNTIYVTGSLLSFDEVELKSEISGRVVKINLPEGQAVKKGTLLVKLFDDDIQADMGKLQAELEIQKQIVNRQTELLKINGISQADYDQSILQLSSIKAEIEVQKTLIRKTEVLAPFDGIIGLRYISPGAIVNSSTLLASLRTEDKIKLDFSVPEKYGSAIKPGMKVHFTMYNHDTDYDASVIATEHEIDAATRNLRVRALVNEKSDELIPGAFANVYLSLSENPNALMVPTQAIIPNERDKTVIVAKNGKAHFVNVKTGIRKASTIEIVTGIQPGDTIIRNGILFLKEGDKLVYKSVTTDSL